MNPNRLLDQRHILRGSQVAEVRVRPERTAFIVPDDKSVVAQVIASCTMQWGGFYHLIIPDTSDEMTGGLWKTVLERGGPRPDSICVRIHFGRMART